MQPDLASAKTPPSTQVDASPRQQAPDLLDLLDAESVAALAETFRMLGDVTRVRILDVLSRREWCVQDIARRLGVSESAISHQLRLLRSLRLVRSRRAGRQVFYALDDHHIIRLFAQGLEHVQESSRAPLARPPQSVQANRGPSRSGEEDHSR
jgi:ArsR family transcriptional regulator, lead/cadmium/zinc/bismuth-responsive transcriptional repressor